MALTSDTEFENYLVSKAIPFTSIIELTGGSANFVWRVQRTDGQSTIFKHAEPYVRSNPAIHFPSSRLAFEATALTTIPSILSLPSASNVHIPLVYSHDPTANVIQINDAGSRNLKESFTDPALDIPAIGTRLGQWLAALHSRTASTDLEDNKAAKHIYRHSYNHVAFALEKYELDTTIGREVNEKYGSLIQTDNQNVCHGDFWPGNILLSDPTSSTDSAHPILTIVDWEMVRRGCGATDVGQFAAEVWLLERFRGKRGLLAAFMKAYRGEVDMDGDFMKRVAVHFGTHLAFWPTIVEWAGTNETREVVIFGRKVLVMMMRDEKGWLDQELFASEG